MNESFQRLPTLLACMTRSLAQLLPLSCSAERLVLICPGTKGTVSLRLSVVPIQDGSWDSYQLVCEKHTIKDGSGPKLDVYVEYPVSLRVGTTTKVCKTLPTGMFIDQLSTAWTKVSVGTSLSLSE